MVCHGMVWYVVGIWVWGQASPFNCNEHPKVNAVPNQISHEIFFIYFPGFYSLRMVRPQFGSKMLYASVLV